MSVFAIPETREPQKPAWKCYMALNLSEFFPIRNQIKAVMNRE
jgi:hypothetical protein